MCMKAGSYSKRQWAFKGEYKCPPKSEGNSAMISGFLYEYNNGMLEINDNQLEEYKQRLWECFTKEFQTDTIINSKLPGFLLRYWETIMYLDKGEIEAYTLEFKKYLSPDDRTYRKTNKVIKMLKYTKLSIDCVSRNADRFIKVNNHTFHSFNQK